jgi:Tol biopolymer transport system component
LQITPTITTLPNDLVQNLTGIVLLLKLETRGIYTANPAGDELNLILENREHSGAALSPDGRKLVYWFDGYMFVHDIPAQETTQVNVERIGSFQYEQMLWSGDGAQVAFDCVPPERFISEVCIMDVAAGTYQVVTDVSQYGAREQLFDGVALGSWSRDGSQIAYTLMLSREGGFAQGVVQIVPLGTGEVHTLFDERAQTEYEQVSTPALSPDGQLLLVQADVWDVPEIFVIDVNTAEMRRITNSLNEYGTTHPVWNPEGGNFFASTVPNPQEGNLVAVPTLFNLNGEILYHMPIGFSGWVLSWQN